MRASGDIEKDKADVICAACGEIARGVLRREFPLDVFQRGTRTSTNMNMNEVIANRADSDRYPIRLGLDRPLALVGAACSKKPQALCGGKTL
ncbi:lyase family protein [Bradyrhizobium acaciae]|uniref:lyase family protein n=1 Tax=Bradyrhizobium acaciae TaxID=2683706 RepID=UPI001E47E040|nr:lyase family protein [Bradyrhizobium acaciae]